jgi:hypothetical protein
METKQLLVFGEKTFKITVPKTCKTTFGPWSPPSKKGNWDTEAKRGTLRIYEGAISEKNIIACFSGVTGFRDLSMGYAEEVAREEGAVIWKDDEKGYQREDKVKRSKEWVETQPVALAAPKKRRK